jgi:hypothetical protein
MVLALGAVVVLGWLAMPGVATAATCADLPPGVSGVDEYCDALPGGGGGSPTPHPSPRGSGPGGGVVKPGTARALRRGGADGRAVLALVEGARSANGRGAKSSGGGEPAGGGDAGGGSGRAAKPGREHVPEQPSGNVPTALGSAAGAGDGISGWFYALLAAVGLGIVGGAIAGKRRA